MKRVWFILGVTFSCVISPAQQPQPGWGHFEPGSSVRTKFVVHTTGLSDSVSMEVQVDTEMELISKKGDTAEVLVKVSVAGKESRNRTKRDLVTSPGNGEKIQMEYQKTGTETITVANQDVLCDVYEGETTGKSGRTTNKVWLTSAIPGGLARKVSQTDNKKTITTTNEEVTAFRVR